MEIIVTPENAHLIRMSFKVKLDGLTMTPNDWGLLNKVVSELEYRQIVMDYQNRESERLPYCGECFGLCRYWVQGRCNCKGYCEFKGIRG